MIEANILFFIKQIALSLTIKQKSQKNIKTKRVKDKDGKKNVLSKQAMCGYKQ